LYRKDRLNYEFYREAMDRLLKRLRRARPNKAESGNWFFLHDDALFHNEIIVKQILAKKCVTVHYHAPYSPDLAPVDCFLFPKVKSNPTGRRFDIIIDTLNNVTSELKSISAAEFYGDIQKLYDRASRHIELGGMYAAG
jgi:hypothetical protein